MKKLTAIISGLGALALIPAMTWAAPGDPGAGLAATKHDFTTLAPGPPPVGLCTFCHTPHNANIQSLLWNHTLSANNFTWAAGSVTIGGTSYSSFNGATYKGPSAKCLSCHDGSVAIGDVGWWNGGVPGAPLSNIKITGANQKATVTGDMTGNHPVAMPFPFGGVVNTYNTVTNGAASVGSGWQADPTATGIRLYVDDGSGNISAGTNAGTTGIECTSCHDPHNGSDVDDVFFLRGNLGTNTANYICVKCHLK